MHCSAPRIATHGAGLVNSPGQLAKLRLSVPVPLDAVLRVDGGGVVDGQPPARLQAPPPRSRDHRPPDVRRTRRRAHSSWSTAPVSENLFNVPVPRPWLRPAPAGCHPAERQNPASRRALEALGETLTRENRASDSAPAAAVNARRRQNSGHFSGRRRARRRAASSPL